MFLHGYLSSKESFYYQTEYFSSYFKIFAPDLTGFKTRDLPYAYSLADYAREVGEYIDDVKKVTGESPSVIAHSFGARILFYLAPIENVDKIVLTGAAGVKQRKPLKVKLKILAYKSIKRLFHKKIVAFESADYKVLSPTMKESFNKIISLDLTDKLSLIRNRTLIINGDKDTATPPSAAKTIHKKIKGSQLVFMKNRGHFCFSEDPVGFNLIVKEFLL